MNLTQHVRNPAAVNGMPAPVALGAGAALGLVLMAVALPGPGVSTFLVRIAELALAGGAAYLIDDAAASVTVTTPRTVWRRRAPRLVRGLGALGLGWVFILVLLRWQDTAPSGLWSTIEVGVLCLAATAVAALLARHGDPEPGGQAAPAVLLVGLALVICEPLLRVTIFVPAGGADFSLGMAWLGLGALSAAVLLLASRDPAGTRSPMRRP